MKTFDVTGTTPLPCALHEPLPLGMGLRKKETIMAYIGHAIAFVLGACAGVGALLYLVHHQASKTQEARKTREAREAALRG